MNYIKKNLLNIILAIFILVLPVLSFAQTAPGWYFQSKYTVSGDTINTEGPFSQQDCTSSVNRLNSIGGELVKNCYEIKASNNNGLNPVNNNGLNPVTSSVKIENPIPSVTSVNGLIETLLKGVIKIGMPILVLAIIYCGFLFVSAQGKPESIKKAKDALLYTLIGAAILLGSWAIAQLIADTVKAL